MPTRPWYPAEKVFSTRGRTTTGTPSLGMVRKPLSTLLRPAHEVSRCLTRSFLALVPRRGKGLDMDEAPVTDDPAVQRELTPLFLGVSRRVCLLSEGVRFCGTVFPRDVSNHGPPWALVRRRPLRLTSGRGPSLAPRRRSRRCRGRTPGPLRVSSVRCRLGPEPCVGG